MENSKKQLLSDANIFAQHIVIALDCLCESRAMNRIFLSKQHKGQYRVARNFYRTAYHAMQYRLQMEVAKLFDVDSKSKSFDNFKNKAFRAELIDQTTKSRYSELRRKAQNDIEELRGRRNKVHAHPDKEFFNEPDKYLEEHPFDYNVIEVLLLEMLGICSNVTIHASEDFLPKLVLRHDDDDFVKLFGYESQADKDFKKAYEKWCGISRSTSTSSPTPSVSLAADSSLKEGAFGDAQESLPL